MSVRFAARSAGHCTGIAGESVFVAWPDECSFSPSQRSGGKSTVPVFLNVEGVIGFKHLLPHQCSAGCKNFTGEADFKRFPFRS